MPTSATSALRVSLLNQSRKDWVENTFAAGPTQDLEGYRDSAIRLQWLTEPSKDFSALANIHARDYDGSARLFRANIIAPGTNGFVPGFDPKRIAIDGKNESEAQNVGANLRLKWALSPGLVLHSITGYEQMKTFSRGDIDGGPPPYVFSGGAGSIPFLVETADGLPDHSQWTQEFRLESDSKGPLDWQVGVYVFREDYKYETFNYDSSNGGAQDGYLRSRQKNNAAALFGAVTYTVSPELKLRGGLRYTHDKKTFVLEEYGYNTFAACFDPSLPAPRCTLADLQALGPTSARTNDKKVSWDASGTYALNKDVNLYARVATGYRGSSVQGASAFNNQSVATPETNTSVEFGVKADLLDRRARLNFGVFSYRVKDLQVTAVGGTGNATILLNADKATGQGFEMDLQALITPNLLATLGIGYNDTKIKDSGLAVSTCGTTQYVFGQPGAPRPNCTVTDPVDSNGRALINGNALPQAPKVTTSFTLRYSQPLAGGEIYALTDWVYRSKVNFFLYDSVEFTGKALTEGGLRVGYLWNNGKYEVAAFGRNITDQLRIVGGIDFNNLTGFINEPRTWGVQFRASF
jgi:iron complex outermembrane recepter protein